MQLPRKMSAQNVMASISRTLGTRSGSKSAAANEVKFAGEESKDKLYEPKHKQKLVRVLTVVAYVISVSLAAIILSLYYMFLWDPRDRAYYTKRAIKPNATSNRIECNCTMTPPPLGAPSAFRHPGITDNVTTIGNDVTTDTTTPPAPSLMVPEREEDFDMRLRKHASRSGEDEEAGTTSTTPDARIYPEESAIDILKNRK